MAMILVGCGSPLGDKLEEARDTTKLNLENGGAYIHEKASAIGKDIHGRASEVGAYIHDRVRFVKDGNRGDRGPQGDQGDQGEVGDVGPRGESGAVGARGAAGADGKPGADGADGVNGQDGVSCAIERRNQSCKGKTLVYDLYIICGDDDEFLMEIKKKKGC